MRSVRYGAIRTRSHSPGPSGPGLSQIALETPSRPRSWTSAARRSVRASSSGRPSRLRRRRRELRDRARVPERVRRLEVDEVARPRAAPRRSARPTARPRARARRRSPRPRSRRRRGPRAARPRRRGPERREGGVELAAAAPARELPGRLGAAGAVRDLDELRELGEARRDRDLPRPRAGPASPCRPTARTPRRARRVASAGSPSSAASERAISAWWVIMSSTSRRPETANSSPTRRRCSGGRPDPRSRSVESAPRAPSSYLPALSAMSSPNHLACSYASVWQPTLISSAV